MGERLRELTDRAIHAGGVASGDDEGALLAERLPHQLDQPFARLQRRRLPPPALDQLIDDRMRCADQDEDRLAVRRGDRFRRFRDRQRDAGRFQPEARCEIDDAARAIALGAEQHVDAIRNQVVVGIGERAVVRVEAREIEVVLRAAAGPPRGRRRGRDGGRRSGARDVDGRAAGAGRAQLDLNAADIRVRQRALRIARRRRLELIQRDHRFHHVAAVRHLQHDRHPLGAVDVVPDVDRRCGGGRNSDAFRGQKLPRVVGDLVGVGPLLIPDMRQMARQHHGGGAQPVVVSAQHGDRRLARHREGRDEAVAGFHACPADGVRGDVRLGERFRADEDRCAGVGSARLKGSRLRSLAI